MPVETEQWHAEIGNFNGWSQLSVIKLFLNMCNLINNMFLVLICTFALSVCCLKFYVFSYLTKVLSFSVLIFFLPVMGSIFCSRFCSLCKHLFVHRPFTNYLHITTFIDLLFSTYFLHVLFLQHGDIETNPGPTKEKIKNLSFCHWNVNGLIVHNLTNISHLEAYNAIYEHDFICISDTFFDSSVTEGDKNIQLNGYNLIRADHPSNIKRGGVYIFYKEALALCIDNSLNFNECIVCEVSIQNRKGYIGVI